jgi:hypothetical protein
MTLSPGGAKRKGDKFERELALYLNVKLGIAAFRAPLSGGGSITPIGGSDLLGTPGIFVEAKRVEKFAPHLAMSQAVRNKAATKSPDLPVVVTRRNLQAIGESLVVMRLDDWLNLYGDHLCQNGIIKEKIK